MGGSSSQTIGYRYFVGIHMAICYGPVDSVNKMYVGKRLVGETTGATGIETPVTSNSTVLINDPNMFGGDKKEGGVYGNLDILLGADDQAQNPYLVSQLGSDIPAFRGTTSLVFRGADGQGNPNLRSFANPNGGAYVTAINPYPKAHAFEVTDIPSANLNPGKENINSGSANGAHIIHEALTDPDWGLGYLDSDINLTSFQDVSNTLFDEGFGLSMIYGQQSKMEDFLREVLTHINGVLYPERTTGKFVLKLIRDDYDVNTLPAFDETNIASLDFFERPAFAELVNEVIISYKRRGEFENSTITAQDLASVQAQETIVSQTQSFPGIDSDDIAAKVAMRELKQLSTPLARCSFVANREAWEVNPGDVIKLSWDDLGVVQVVLRVISVNYGTLSSGLVQIEAVEDIFGLPNNSYITPQQTSWSDEVVSPAPASSSLVGELPYFVMETTFDQASLGIITEDSVFIQASTESPSSAVFNVQMLTRTGANPFAFATDGAPTPTATLSAVLDEQTTTGISISNSKGNLSNVAVGSYAYLNGEVLRIDAVDVANNLIDVGRGYMDSIPQRHLANDVIYFSDSNSAVDLTEYASGDSVDVKLLTQTSLGVLPEASAPTENVATVGRQNKPYNASQIRINGQYFPTALTEEFSILVTWAHQDRTQQLVVGGSDWYNTSLGSPEAGTTYSVEYYNDTTDTLLYSQTGLTGTQSSFSPSIAVSSTISVRVEVKSVRNGEESFQTFSHVFDYTKPIGVRTLRNASDPADVRFTTTVDRRVIR